MKCPTCGHENPTDADFCEECAAELVGVCGACGTPNAPPAKFCKRCGAAFRLYPVRLSVGSVRAPDHGGLLAILFTDIESSAAIRQRLGDARAQDVLHTHNAIVREALRTHGGSEIKHTGDGIMASFPSATHALQCAVAVEQAVVAHGERHAEASFSVYIGLNAGEPIAEEEDLFGTAVDLARRICDQAQGGEIFVSDVVRQLVAGKGFHFSDHGAVALRGFEDPVRLYEVRWQESG